MMLRGTKLCAFLTALLLALAALTPAVSADESIPKAAIKASVNAKVSAARRIAPEIGVHIVELASDEPVYSYHPDVTRIAASNTKIATTAAALDRLGPGFFFETELLVRGTVDENGTLNGDLAVVGGGDPNISGRHYYGDSYAVFREWAAALTARGIARVSGELVLVDGLFDDELVHPDWPRNQLDRWYEAPVAALSFNDNCVLVKVSPDAPGAPAEVETVPRLDIFRIESSARTIASGGQGVAIGRKSGGLAHVLTVSGKVHRRTESVDKWVTVADPVRYFGAALRDAFAEEGLEITGPSRAVRSLVLAHRDAALPWERAAIHRTDLLTTLEIINKRSQNFYAESVLKTLGARLCGDGTWAAGVRVVQEFLAELGLDPAAYSMADGSGMSRGNRFTPRQLTTMLAEMFHHAHRLEWLRTFPVSGELGLRWEKRLAKAPYVDNVMAKTGTLSGVSALSGYAKARSGRLYVFSILMNRARSAWQSQNAQDAIVRALIDNG